MIFAFDYDGTFTSDPSAFIAIVRLLQSLTHVCVLVTARSDDETHGREPKKVIGDLMPIVFADGGWKDAAARRAGYKVDIWVDDEPEGVRDLREALAVEKHARSGTMAQRARHDEDDDATSCCIFHRTGGHPNDGCRFKQDAQTTYGVRNVPMFLLNMAEQEKPGRAKRVSCVEPLPFARMLVECRHGYDLCPICDKP